MSCLLNRFNGSLRLNVSRLERLVYPRSLNVTQVSGGKPPFPTLRLPRSDCTVAGLNIVQRLIQICNYIIGIFQAHRDPNQAIRNTKPLAFRDVHRRVCHRGWM